MRLFLIIPTVILMVHMDYIPPVYLTIGIHLSAKEQRTQFYANNLIINTPNTNTNIHFITNYFSLVTKEYDIRNLLRYRREDRASLSSTIRFTPFDDTYEAQFKTLMNLSSGHCYKLTASVPSKMHDYELSLYLGYSNQYYEYNQLKINKDKRIYATYYPLKKSNNNSTSTVGISYVQPLTSKTGTNYNLLEDKTEVYKQFNTSNYQIPEKYCLNFDTYEEFVNIVNKTFNNDKPVTYFFLVKCEHGCITSEEYIYSILTKVATLLFFILFFLFLLKLFIFKYSIHYEEIIQICYFGSNLIFIAMASVWYLNKRKLNFGEVFSYNLTQLFMTTSLGIFTMLMLNDEFIIHNNLVHLNNLFVSILFFITFFVNTILSMLPKRHLRSQIYRSWALIISYIFIFFTIAIIKSKRLNSGKQVQGTSFAKRKVLFLLLMVAFVIFLGLFMFKIVEDKGSHRVVDSEIIILVALVNLLGMLFIFLQVGNRKKRVKGKPKNIRN